MKPRLGFGRQQVVNTAQPELAAGDVNVGSSDDREDGSSPVESTRAANEAPIRPDLGPPAQGPNPPISRDRAWGWSSASLSPQSSSSWRSMQRAVPPPIRYLSHKRPIRSSGVLRSWPRSLREPVPSLPIAARRGRMRARKMGRLSSTPHGSYRSSPQRRRCSSSRRSTTRR